MGCVKARTPKQSIKAYIRQEEKKWGHPIEHIIRLGLIDFNVRKPTVVVTTEEYSITVFPKKKGKD